MEDDIGSLQPWQIFSALYLGFWALSAYFDHFLMTFVFCLAFGVMSEIATRYMNGEHLASSFTGGSSGGTGGSGGYNSTAANVS